MIDIQVVSSFFFSSSFFFLCYDRTAGSILVHVSLPINGIVSLGCKCSSAIALS